MSYTTHIDGSIDITPPLPWKQIKESPYLKANARAGNLWPDVLFNIAEETIQTDDGDLTRRTAVAIIPDEDVETSGRTVLSDVQAIIDTNPGHEFSGFLECEGEENSDIWRVVIRGRKAVKVKARIVWPEDGVAAGPVADV